MFATETMTTIGAGKKISATQPKADGRRDLVERVIGSAVFAKSERLSSFLSYICEMTLKGQADELNEQRIGEAVFGRPPDYDSSVDGIVRTQASRLRQRLDLYFDEEGAGEPIRIVVPRGGYVPLFEPRLPASALPPSPPLTFPVNDVALSAEKPGKAEANRSSKAILTWSLIAVLSAIVAGFFFTTLKSEHKEVSPLGMVNPLWGALFREGGRTTIVVGDSGLVIWQGLARRNMGLDEYLAGEYRLRKSNPGEPSQIDSTNLGNRRYTSIVDLEVAQGLSSIAQSRKAKPQVRFARDIRPNDLKEGNVVLIGAAEANPWIHLFEPNMNFALVDDQPHRVFSVINRSPVGSEPSHWDSLSEDPERHVYAVVALLPNVSGTGNVLIIEGTSMAGTECGWDFVTDDSRFVPFLNKMKQSNGIMPHFQVVLGTNNMGGSSVKSQILAWRSMN